MARATTPGSVRPVLTAVQLPPPSVLLKTPPPDVPAYSVAGFVGSIASARISPPAGPLAVHVLTPAEATPARLGQRKARLARSGRRHRTPSGWLLTVPI